MRKVNIATSIAAGFIGGVVFLVGCGSGITNNAIAAVDNFWENIGTTIFYTGGNVGIGTNNPEEQLHLDAGQDEVAIIKLGTQSNGRNINIVGNPGGPAIYYQMDNQDPLIDIENNLMMIRSTGNIGVGGTSTPNSKLQIVNGYLQLDITNGNAPSSTNCDDSEEYGRMVIDETNSLLYICVSSGWVSK